MRLQIRKNLTTTCAVAVWLAAATTGITAQDLDSVLFSVNERKVTQEDLLQRVELRLLALEQSGLAPELLEGKRQEAQEETLQDLYERRFCSLVLTNSG